MTRQEYKKANANINEIGSPRLDSSFKEKGRSTMKPLEEWLSEKRAMTIETLTSYIKQYIDEQWQHVLQQNQEEFQRIYDKAGEGAYGTYAQRLFRPIREQLTRAGFLSEPGFPGTLSTSLEWGPLEERERWMWCLVRPAQGAPVGTIVIRLVHDHTQFRLPQPPGVLALEETDADAIVQAVSDAAGHLKSEGKRERME
jgi:hypothetical protein